MSSSDTKERIHKYLAHCGYGSRRSCEDLVRQKRVQVNGEWAHIGQKISPKDDVIRVDGEEVQRETRVYYMMNKPAGTICSLDPVGDIPSVVELVDDHRRIYPVGRLDVETTGLLLLTNDGDLTHALTHPSHDIEKVYRVRVKGHVSKKTEKDLAYGVVIDGKKTRKANVRCRRRGRKVSRVDIGIKEGRNRQIRKMCATVGHPVIDLKRIRIGPLKLGKLMPGEVRRLTQKEVRRLKKAAGLS